MASAMSSNNRKNAPNIPTAEKTRALVSVEATLHHVRYFCVGRGGVGVQEPYNNVNSSDDFSWPLRLEVT